MRLSGDLLDMASKAGMAYATGGASLATEALGSGGGAMPASGGVTVSPTIQAAISPQISPVFIQTGAGSTGAVSAGTSMTAGTTQQGAPAGRPAPYSDIGYPYAGLPPDIAPMPALVQDTGWQKYVPYAMGAIALIGVASMLQKQKKKTPIYRKIARA